MSYRPRKDPLEDVYVILTELKWHKLTKIMKKDGVDLEDYKKRAVPRKKEHGITARNSQVHLLFFEKDGCVHRHIYNPNGMNQEVFVLGVDTHNNVKYTAEINIQKDYTYPKAWKTTEYYFWKEYESGMWERIKEEDRDRDVPARRRKNESKVRTVRVPTEEIKVHFPEHINDGPKDRPSHLSEEQKKQLKELGYNNEQGYFIYITRNEKLL